MTDNLVIYHLHSDNSLLDSCTGYKLYIDRAAELGQPAIAFSEHGKPLNWVKKKMYCDEKGIKYIHGVEIYLTESLNEKVRDNYHTVLIARNEQGVKELNLAVSRSCDKDHFYYVNRLSFDEFLKLSNNIITTSACLASPLNKLPVDHPMYESLVKRYDFLEIQSHDCQEQRDFNVHLAELAKKYSKPLIAGTDTHSLDKYKAECRKILLKYKNKSYGDEDTYDLTYKSREELDAAFAKQGVLPPELYRQAMDNTLVMADMVEPFELDTSIKYPILYGSAEEDSRIEAERVDRMFKEKLETGVIPPEQEEGFRSALVEERRVFEKLGMSGFMLCMSELICWCKENDVPVGPGRGSAGGSRTAFVTDIIDCNPEQWHTVFSRFANEDRKEIGDIDVDVKKTDQPKVFNYIYKRFGARKTSRVPSFGTLQKSAVIKCVGNALAKYWEEERTGKPFKPADKFSPDNPYSLSNVDKIASQFATDEGGTRTKFPKLFYYYDGLLDTKVSQSIHAAGIVISPLTLDDTYGVFDKDGDPCLFIDMDELHEVGAAKFDFLPLSNVGIISDTCKLAGIHYPRMNEINFDDQAVWKDMLRSPVGIFQMESSFAFSLLKTFEPHSIFDMALVTAAIRPSGASYRDRLMKKIPNKNPSKEIDELLKNNLGYLIFQEDIIAFLQQMCGLSGSEADNVRRAIGRKDAERLEKAIPKILNGYCEHSSKPRKEAEEDAKAFLKVIEDASEYSFGYNHAVEYCLTGYLCAYLRKYYPCEFITTYLNRAAKEEDVVNGTTLAAEYGFKVTPPRFGASRDVFYFNKEKKEIAKGLTSVKYMSAALANELYDIYDEVKGKSFMEVLKALSKTSIDTRQLDILIKIGYFEEFGNMGELLKLVQVYSFFKNGTAKSVSKSKVVGFLTDIISDYATDKGVKGNELKSYTITDMDGLLAACEEQIRKSDVPDLTLKVKIQNSIEYLGYVGIQTGLPEDRRKLLITEVFPMRGQNGVPWGYKVNTQSLGTGKQSSLTIPARIYAENQVAKGDIVYADNCYKNPKGYWYLNSYRKI